MLLAIDTSAGTSVAVVDGDRVLSEASDPGTRGHAELIGTLIQQALADAEASPADITGVVSGMGPGPFTGLRVGIAAARAFAASRDIPVHPVASHDAVAFGRTAPTLVVTDARRREVAWTTYDADGANTSGPHLAHPEDLETVPASPAIGQGPDPWSYVGRRDCSVPATGLGLADRRGDGRLDFRRRGPSRPGRKPRRVACS